MKIIMFFASLLIIPFCILLAIIPASFLSAVLNTDGSWLIWIFTAIFYFSGLRILLSIVNIKS